MSSWSWRLARARERSSLLRRAPGLWSCSCSQAEDGQRPPEEFVLVAGAQDTGGIGPVCGLCVQYRLPADAWLVRWENEGNRLVVGIQEHEEGITDDPLAHVVDLLDGIADQTQAQAPAEPVGPLFFRHLQIGRASCRESL